ncbi:hypothetical protein ACFWQG_06440 [Rhodococcus sp. NPDC058532]|uniref:hypothetical protein n=1 Tax=Rhodococcus sp. NPDC058532 TaxID=3346540 RepID=UPI0036635C47
MGYTTEFTGQIRIDPPLNEAERDYLTRFARSRRMRRPAGPYALGDATDEHLDIALQNNPPYGQPALNCQWVPTADGSALEWNGHEKFYRSSGWMTYLIDTFLRPGAFLRNEMRYESACEFPPQLAHFTFDHTLTGTVVATGQDGARWCIEVIDNEVAVREVNGPAPVEYAVFVVPRHDDYQLDREFDAAFDLGRNQFARIRADDPTLPELVADCVRSVHPGVVDGDFEGLASLVDPAIGLRVTIIDDAVRIGLLADPGLDDADHTFGLVQRLVAALTVQLGWIAFDPAQRVAVRPTTAFRNRAIDLIRGWIDEPEGRYLWNVV